jgi:hypothetical protein
MRFALAYDEEALFLGATITDERFISDHDAVVIRLSLPTEARRHVFEIQLYAGVPGRVRAHATLVEARTAALLDRAEVVEGPIAGDGYALEARIPWGSLPGGENWPLGRGAVGLRDVDQEAHPDVEAELTTASTAELDRLAPTGSRSGFVAFVESFGLDRLAPTKFWRADVDGNGSAEHVVIIDRYLAVTGPGYLSSGTEFHELAIDDAQDLERTVLRDLTGDGRPEMAVTLRQRNSLGARVLWQVLAIDRSPIRPLLSIEARKETSRGSLESPIAVRAAESGAPIIEQRLGSADRLDEASYDEAPSEAVIPILLPWGPIAKRTLRWDGSGFAVLREWENPSRSSARARAVSRPRPPVPEARAPAPQVLARFFAERGVDPSARPTLRLEENLVGDARPEELRVYGLSLVIVGSGVGGGRGYLFFEIPARDVSDVLSVTIEDATGDEFGEVWIRVRQRLGAVERELLLIHELTEQGFPRLFAAEVTRRQGNNVIENQVRVTGRGSARTVRIEPRRVRGWTAQNWPFAPMNEPGIQPLRLPWE